MCCSTLYSSIRVYQCEQMACIIFLAKINIREFMVYLKDENHSDIRGLSLFFFVFFSLMEHRLGGNTNHRLQSLNQDS